MATEPDRAEIPASPVRGRRHAAKTQFLLGNLNLVISVVQGIAMVPMYLHYVGAHLYGLWLGAGGIAFWLSVLDLGISGLMGQRMATAYGRHDSGLVARYYFNGALVQLVLLVLVVLAGFPIAWFAPLVLRATASETIILRWTTLLSCISLGVTFANYGQTNAAFALQRPFVPCLVTVCANVVSTLATAIMLWLHFGLYAIAGGALLGAVLSYAANLIYVTGLVRSISTAFHFDRAVLIDMLRLSPALIVSRLGHAIAGRIEPAVISLTLSPELAVAYSVTKRSADVIQMGLDRIIGSITAGFTHLLSEGGKARASAILDTTVTSTFALSMVTLSVYAASNRLFVGFWVGTANFAGQGVTLLIAFSVLALFLNNTFSYLLSAAGEIASSSLVMSLEAGARVGLMYVLLPFLGLSGLPAAVGLSAGGFALWFAARLHRLVREKNVKEHGLLVQRSLLAAILLPAAAALGFWWPGRGPVAFIAAASLSALAAALIVAAFDTRARRLAMQSLGGLRRAAVARF